MAAANWTGLFKLCLKQREGDQNSNGHKVIRASNFQKFTVAASPKPVMKYLPTYRLEPKVPLNKEVCEKIIKTVMDKTFQDFVYAPKPALSLCAEVSEEIKNRVKNLNFDRYRYIVLVSIGEKLYQGYYSLVNFLWDPEKDGYLSYVYDTPKFFAVATLYYLYYD
ncbi:dynein light chain Tctex-type protein 2B isoform 1-T1 [Glossina fuscipes fuscipes]